MYYMSVTLIQVKIIKLGKLKYVYQEEYLDWGNKDEVRDSILPY